MPWSSRAASLEWFGKRELNRLEQHDQGCQSLLAVDNLNDGILVRNDCFQPAIEADHGRHEMPLFRAVPQPINILEHVLPLLRAPRIRTLVLRYPEEAIRQEIRQ